VPAIGHGRSRIDVDTPFFAPFLPASCTIVGGSIIGNKTYGGQGGDEGDGGNGGNGGAGDSGGIGSGVGSLSTGSPTMSHVDVVGNLAYGGAGGDGGKSGNSGAGGRSRGAGLFVGSDMTAMLTDVNLTRNVANAGAGGDGGDGGSGGQGGTAYAGGLFNAVASTTLTHVSLTRNQAIRGVGGSGGVGGNGGAGGDALGGGVYTSDSYIGGGITPETGPSSLTSFDSSFTRNEADGGSGGAGGTRRLVGRSWLRDRRRPVYRRPTIYIDVDTTFVKTRRLPAMTISSGPTTPAREPESGAEAAAAQRNGTRRAPDAGLHDRWETISMSSGMPTSGRIVGGSRRTTLNACAPAVERIGKRLFSSWNDSDPRRDATLEAVALGAGRDRVWKSRALSEPGSQFSR
jgi:hypothetical protein